jgi:hypothetical protein
MQIQGLKDQVGLPYFRVRCRSIFHAWLLLDCNSPPNVDLHSQKTNEELHMHLIYELIG